MKFLNSIRILMGFFWIACGGWFTWFEVGALVVSAVGGAVEANQTKKALQGQQGMIDRLQYQPVDVNKLAADAHTWAVNNATNSLALEKQLSPGVAATRTTLQNQVASQLALGGKLSPDTLNQATQAGRTIGSSTGNLGNSAPLTAALIGQSSEALRQQRMANASGLLQANPLPVAGLDPGALASLVVSQNNAQNQFNLAKTGAQAGLLGANAQANNTEIGGLTSALSGFVGGLGGGIKAPTTNTSLPNANTLSFGGDQNAFGSLNFGNPLSANIQSYGGTPAGGWTCWVARSVYTAKDPRWLVFREWMLHDSPAWFRHLYLRYGERFAAWLDRHPLLKPAIRVWMDSRIIA